MILTFTINNNGAENSLFCVLCIQSQKMEYGKLYEQQCLNHLSRGISQQPLSNRPDVQKEKFAFVESYYATGVARSQSLALNVMLGWRNNRGFVNSGRLRSISISSIVKSLLNKVQITTNYKVVKLQHGSLRFTFQQSLLDVGKELNDVLVVWNTTNECIKVNTHQIQNLRCVVR